MKSVPFQERLWERFQQRPWETFQQAGGWPLGPSLLWVLCALFLLSPPSQDPTDARRKFLQLPLSSDPPTAHCCLPLTLQQTLPSNVPSHPTSPPLQRSIPSNVPSPPISPLVLHWLFAPSTKRAWYPGSGPASHWSSQSCHRE